MKTTPTPLMASIERSLFKSHRKELWTPFLHGMRDYQLIRPGDRIAVCVSGGKDSTLLAVLFAALAKVTAIPFEARYICMDPGYKAEDRALIEGNAAVLGLPLHIFETNVFDAVLKASSNRCYLCARMRRGHLYKEAQLIGCNKIALAHHFNDVVETTLMGMLYGAQIQTMMPKLRSKNFPRMELIRPMYLIKEKDVIAWRDRHGLDCLHCGCPVYGSCDLEAGGHGVSKRAEVKRLISELNKTHPNVEQCIFQSIHHVNLNTVIGYVRNGEKHLFTDDYDDNMVEEDD